MHTTNLTETIYLDLKRLGLVQNQDKFSIFCGRKRSWYSVLKSKNLPFTTDAALTLSTRLRRMAEIEILPERSAELAKISTRLLEIAQFMAAEKVGHAG